MIAFFVIFCGKNENAFVKFSKKRTHAFKYFDAHKRKTP